MTDPDPRKRVPVTEARHPEPKIAAVRAPGGGKHPYVSRRSATPNSGERSDKSKTRAQKTRRGNEMGCLKSE